MLRSFHIENFKSLHDFKIDDIGQFICLIGLNGAGKTTLLQALDFMAHLAAGEVDSWLKEREWSRNDLPSKFNRTNKRLINFRLEFDLGKRVVWEGSYNTTLGRCTAEELRVEDLDGALFQLSDGQLTLQVADGTKNVSTMRKIDVSHFALKDSILAFVAPAVKENKRIIRLWKFLCDIKSLELLSPHRMRMKSRVSDDVGIGGEKLSGYLHGLKATEKKELLTLLKDFYPRLSGLGTKSQRAGWAQTQTLERYDSADGGANTHIETDAQHLNDGLLRILTIIAQTKSDHSFLLFDEIENGINPEKIGQLVSYLTSAKKQILVTTHNPVILNYLPDELAKDSVFFLYRDRYGATKTTRFFELPEVAEKLEVLGPGEAFLDTSLEELSTRLAQREALSK